MNRLRLAGDWRYTIAIAVILALAVALRLIAYSPWDQHHADEFYQYLEQANRLVAGHGLIPWESRYGIRNALIPQFLAVPIWLGNLFAPTSMLPIHLARLSFAALCLVALAGAWGIGAARSRRHALVALFVAAIWYDSVQFSVLLLSESIATAVIACGAALLLMANPGRRWLWLGGFLLVLGILLRFQYAPFVAVLVLATARLDWRTWRELAVGAFAALALGMLSDIVDGRVPMLWILDNFRMNIGEGRAAEFGEEGPLYYPEMIFLALGPAIPAILAAAALSGRRYWPLMLAIVVNVALHTLIGHKEYRFIWLSAFLILVLAAVGSVNAVEWLIQRRKPGQTAGWLPLALLCAGWFGLSQTVLGEESVDERLKLEGGAVAMAAHDVAARTDICGISVPEDQIDYVVQALLRRKVPVYVVPLELAGGLSSMPPELTAAANATIAPEELMLDPEYEAVSCHEHGGEEACLLVRPGACDSSAAADYDYQETLNRTDI